MRRFFLCFVFCLAASSAHAYSAGELRADLVAGEPLDNGIKLDVSGLIADARATAFIGGVTEMLSAESVVCFASASRQRVAGIGCSEWAESGRRSDQIATPDPPSP